MLSSYVIFTDLDGTLLDYESYSFKPALPALTRIKTKNIPLVICSSKTRSEIEFYRKQLENSDPFVSENGGGIFIPQDYFCHDFGHDKLMNGYKIIELGKSHKILIDALDSIKKETGLGLKSFSDMTIEELSEMAGLGRELAELAMMREYDEPFLLEQDSRDSERIKFEINRRGFRHTEGGIFHHISGENDKGKAVDILIELFKDTSPNLKTIGIGDSLNDLPMLQVVDIPILVRKPDGLYDSRVNVSSLVRAQGVGPEGWNETILGLIDRDGVTAN